MENQSERSRKELQPTGKRSRKAKKKDELTQAIRKSAKESLKIKGHHYTVETIQLSVQQVIESENSYRGVATTMKLLSQSFLSQTPHYSSIKKWVGRIGLTELKREKEKRKDWIFIVDLTLELGREKAIVIYGISEQVWREKVLEEGRGLKHTDGEILEIKITEIATGEWIKKTLEDLTIKTGIPRQILGDHGSNLKKGIELYRKNHPEVIYTYDVTHGMANLLKKELVSSEIYQKFLSDCRQCRQELQQTELAFLAPPSQRSLRSLF